jgi:hypothetical protein
LLLSLELQKWYPRIVRHKEEKGKLDARATRPTDDIFQSAVRSDGSFAGVFEYESGTAYFYLYDTKREKDHKVVGAIRILVGAPDFDDEQVDIMWDKTETKVGLFIRDQLWATFDLEGRIEYGGNYEPNKSTSVPLQLRRAFRL